LVESFLSCVENLVESTVLKDHFVFHLGLPAHNKEGIVVFHEKAPQLSLLPGNHELFDYI
jgi:hypothetical protein